MANRNANGLIGDDASLWDASDVARYLKVSRSWVYHRAESGLLPCLRIGALLRFEPAKVKDFALGRRSGTPPTKPVVESGMGEQQPETRRP